MILNNKYYILRHGQAISNVKDAISCWPEKFYNPLTLKGKKQIKVVAKKLKMKKIALIFSSDLLRTRQTAEIIAKELNPVKGYKDKKEAKNLQTSNRVKIKPKYDKILRELDVGIFNGKPIQELKDFLPVGEKRFRTGIPKGENYSEIRKRMYDFLKDINKKYSGKNILIISHQLPLALLEAKIKSLSIKEFFSKSFKEKRLKTGELRKL